MAELLSGPSFVSRLVVLGTVGSTNDELRELAAGGAAEGTVVLADHQTRGRGRMGRRWHSPPGLGLYVSVLLRPAGPPQLWTRWTLAAAVAACGACRAESGGSVSIKWPNDLLWRGKKLGGVLAESRVSAPGGAELLLGLGVNVLQQSTDFSGDLGGRATSLRLLSGRSSLEREALAAQYLTRLGQMAALLAQGDWSSVAAGWERLSTGAFGQRVRVVSGPGVKPGGYEGVTQGLDSTGALRVRRDDGVMGTVQVAESVLPVE